MTDTFAGARRFDDMAQFLDARNAQGPRALDRPESLQRRRWERYLSVAHGLSASNTHIPGLERGDDPHSTATHTTDVSETTTLRMRGGRSGFLGIVNAPRMRARQVAYERPERADEARAHTGDRGDDAALCDHRDDAPAQKRTERHAKHNGQRSPPHFFLTF